MKTKDIVIALNSTNDIGFKYPIGNADLTKRVRELESQGLIYYKAHESKWYDLSRGKNVFFNERTDK